MNKAESLDKARLDWEGYYLGTQARLNWEDLSAEVRDSQPVLGVLRAVCQAGCQVAEEKALGAESWDEVVRAKGTYRAFSGLIEAIDKLKELSVEVKTDE